MAEEKGTGKHPHKSSEEPYPHREGKSGKQNEEGSEQQKGSKSASGGQSHSGGGSRSQSNQGNESSDLKEREYKDAQGNVHHHTHTYQEQHKGEK